MFGASEMSNIIFEWLITFRWRVFSFVSVTSQVIKKVARSIQIGTIINPELFDCIEDLSEQAHLT